jgi:hypothetical protein
MGIRGSSDPEHFPLDHFGIGIGTGSGILDASSSIVA